MNDKVKQLLENAEQSDAIAKNKWRIENREQLRKERKEKLKELMEKDKQQTAVDWYIIKRDEIEMKTRLMLISPSEYEQELIKADEQAKEMHKQQAIKLHYEYLLYVMMNESSIMTFGQFYKQTYGGGEQ
jgi:hypothetical protein